jgi:hypothetical protein
MSQETHENKPDDLKSEIERSRQALETLRDEIRVRLHLAGMEARDAWAELGKEADRVSAEINRTTRDALHVLVGKWRAFRDALEAKPKA